MINPLSLAFAWSKHLLFSLQKLDEQDFGEAKEINKRKRMILEGMDPDAETQKKKKKKRDFEKRMRKKRKERKGAKEKASTSSS